MNCSEIPEIRAILTSIEFCKDKDLILLKCQKIHNATLKIEVIVKGWAKETNANTTA